MSIKRKFKVIGIVLLIIIGGIGLGYSINKIAGFLNGDAQEVKKPISDPNYAVTLSDEDFKAVEEISLKLGYKREYNFTPDFKVEDFIYEDTADSGNFFSKAYKKTMNSTDKVLNKKEFSFDVSSIVLMGYSDGSFEKEDFTYKASEKTLYVKSPQLQMAVLIDFSNAQRQEGGFTYLFNRISDSEIESFQTQARKQIEDKFLTEEEVKLAYEFTNNSLAKQLKSSKDFSFEIEKVVFEENNEPVKILNNELRNLAEENNFDNNELSSLK